MTTTSSIILTFVALPLPGASFLITPWALMTISVVGIHGNQQDRGPFHQVPPSKSLAPFLNARD